MRADRLIALLMLLQSRGRLTAEALSAELEVSVRTIYRDLEALSTAGIPVYAERGVGGGCALLEDYRANLASLTEAEARSLFILSVPEPLAALGMGQTLKSAYLKLAAALPGLRRSQELGRARVHLDWSGWRSSPVAPHLMTAYQAAAENRCLNIRYSLANGMLIDQLVEPYGVVAKAGTWYLVYAAKGKLSWLRLSDLREAEIKDQAFSPPVEFDLAAYWQVACAEVEREARAYRVLVRADPAVVPVLTGQPEAAIAGLLPSGQAWQEVALYFDSFEAARERLLALGRAVEIVAPEPLRRSVLDFAAQICDFYNQLNQI